MAARSIAERPTMRARGLRIVVFGGCLLACGAAHAASVTREVRDIGLAPLYTALFAVSNCPALAIDEQRFLAVSRAYRLSSEDFTPTGPFAAEIDVLSKNLAQRLEDDRAGFCGSYDLAFAVPEGILRRR